MPELLHREAGIGGNCAQARSKRSICVRLRGADSVFGGDEMAHRQNGREGVRSGRGRAAGRARRSPSRFMPVSIWIAAGCGRAVGGAELGPFGHFGQRTQHRNELRGRIERRGGRREAVEDEDARLRAASRPPRARPGAKSRLRARWATKKVLQPSSSSARATGAMPEAIGVGLDHSGAFRASRAIGEAAPVLGQGAEIDGEDRLAHRPGLIVPWDRPPPA